jgi:hypothetical protein
MATYSFNDVVAAITGTGGTVNLGAGAAIAAEGISIEPVEDKNVMTVGADGQTMHSLVASSAATVTVRLLKTSPTNRLLQEMFNVQTASASTHGSNVITIRDVARGDTITLTDVAFKNSPSLTYAKEGGTVEWVFDAGRTSRVLGGV